MARVEDDELVAVVDVRLDVIVRRGGIGQRGEDVERGERSGGRLNPRRFRGDGRTELLEHLELALEDPLISADDLLFVLFERRGDEPLAAGNRLFAMIVGR